MQKEIKKAAVGMLIVFGSIFLISLIVPHKVGAAEMDSTERNPGLDKVTELGTAMKMWAIGFGTGVGKNATESKMALINDIERLKNSKFVQDQKKGFEQSREQLARNQEQIRQLPSRIKEDTTNLFITIGNALNKIMVGGKNNDGKDQK